MPRKERRIFKSEEKMTILRSHLVLKTPLSEICEHYSIQPTQFYKWQTELFEKGESVFTKTRESPKLDKKYQEKIDRLEKKLTEKHEVISELLHEHIQLKKNLGEG